MGKLKISEAAKNLWGDFILMAKKPFFKWTMTSGMTLAFLLALFWPKKVLIVGLMPKFPFSFYYDLIWLNSLPGWCALFFLLHLIWQDELKNIAAWADQSTKLLSFLQTLLVISIAWMVFLNHSQMTEAFRRKCTITVTGKVIDFKTDKGVPGIKIGIAFQNGEYKTLMTDKNGELKNSSLEVNKNALEGSVKLHFYGNENYAKRVFKKVCQS